MPIAIIALFLGAFCIGTTEFVVAGLLPDISSDLGVSIPTAGYLVSVYAIGVAIGGPIITIATAHFPRKINLILLMFLFIAGHVWCALAPNFEVLLAGRLIVALSHGSFFGVATVVATSIVPPNRVGAAVAWLFAGITVANILGVPGGTAIGNWLGWRATFWVVGALAVAVTFIIMAAVKEDGEEDGERPGLDAQIFALANQKVLLTYLTFGIMLVGFWSFFTFIAPFLLNVSAIASEWLPVVLFMFGIGATVGTMLGGRLSDLYPIQVLVLMFPAQVITWIAIAVSASHPEAIAVLIFVFGVIGFLPGSAIVNRILSGAARAPDLASTLVATAANIGIAAGAVVGGQVLAAGIGYQLLPWIGAVCAAIATGIMLLSLGIDRRTPQGISS